jgi:hypothetical protein
MRDALTPDTPGPLRLRQVHQLKLPNSPFTVTAPRPSPDGRGTAVDFLRDEKPAITPDGRHALIALTPVERGRKGIGLISMRNGRILQRLDRPWSRECAWGFGDDGKSAWASNGSLLAAYGLDG